MSWNDISVGDADVRRAAQQYIELTLNQKWRQFRHSTVSGRAHLSFCRTKPFPPPFELGDLVVGARATATATWPLNSVEYGEPDVGVIVAVVDAWEKRPLPNTNRDVFYDNVYQPNEKFQGKWEVFWSSGRRGTIDEKSLDEDAVRIVRTP